MFILFLVGDVLAVAIVGSIDAFLAWLAEAAS